MQVCEENWDLGQASRNFTFKFQAEKDELEQVTKKEHIERSEKTGRACCRGQGGNCQDFHDAGSSEMST